MTLLVTLEEAKAHLYAVEHEDDDEQIEFKIAAASEMVLGYLKSAALAFVDSSGEIVRDSSGADAIPMRVKMATLVLVTALYENRGGDGGKGAGLELGMGYLPPYVTAILYPLRTPTIA